MGKPIYIPHLNEKLLAFECIWGDWRASGVISEWSASNSEKLSDLVPDLARSIIRLFEGELRDLFGVWHLERREVEDQVTAYYVALDFVSQEIIPALSISGKNCARLLDGALNWNFWSAYQRLVEDYRAYLNFETLTELVRRAHSTFIFDEATERWSKYKLVTTVDTPPIALLVQDIAQKYQKVADGHLISVNRLQWDNLIRQFGKNWDLAFQVPPRKWEEIIAAGFDAEGWDRVTLTPPSRDHGRDVIAEKYGFGAVKVAISVKAYKRDHLVSYDDVRALAGVVGMDPSVSKGIITTLSDFPPQIMLDPIIAQLVPYRLELINGVELRRWLRRLTNDE